MTLRFNKISSIIVQILLGVLFLLSAIRFIGILIQFGHNLLQMDFSAYYTAGEALNYGLSPYLNNVSNTPPLWDGIDHFRFSRFLYPPLVAVLFRPLALVPYATAKYLWEAITLLCLVASLYLTSRLFPLKTIGQVFLVGIAVSLYYPLQTHLDRGQIDLVTLLIITVSILLMMRNTRNGDTLAGGLLVFATLLKLHCIYVLPFLLVKRRWESLKGYIYGGMLLVVASVILFGGPRSLYDYVRYQLPRISGIATVDDKLGKANNNAISSIRQNLSEDYTVQDGQVYKISHFSLVPYATLVAPIMNFLAGHSIDLSRTVISLLLFAIFFALFWWWERKYAGSIDSKQKEFLFWQIPFLLILLTAPLTWVMNTVWLLPCAVIVVSLYPAAKNTQHRLSILMMGLGFIIVMLDNASFAFLNDLSLDKSMLGELMLLLALVYYLSRPLEAPDASG